MYIAHIEKDLQTSEVRIQTCEEHARAAAALAQKALEPCGLSATGYMAGLVHDMGKCTDEFKNYLEKAAANEKVRKGSIIHTFAGVRYLLERFRSGDEPAPQTNIVSEILAASVGGHHGLFDLWDERHQSGFGHRLDHQPEYDRRAIAAFHKECADEQEVQSLYRQAEEEILTFLTRKVSQCVADNNEICFAFGLLTRLITSAVVNGDRTDTRCFMENRPLPINQPPSWEACAVQINAHIGTFSQTTPIQNARMRFSDLCAEKAMQSPGLFRLDLPTGGGKTLAALRFAVLHAQRNYLRRVFYIAPLLSILEQNAEVIRKAVNDTVPVLEHHSNLLLEGVPAGKAAVTELLQETWEAPVIITTFVQLLNTLFSGKMSAVRRFHSLCESVIIIDEVQALPTKMLSLFNCAVNFLVKCCGTTVVLCSATQPPLAAEQLQHAMLPCERLISEEVYDHFAPLFKRTEITYVGHQSFAELATLAESTLETRNSLLIVCNTKKEAAKLFQLLSDIPYIRLFHLSAGMCMAHRKQTLKDIKAALETNVKLICVSTQVIEAGVDISFDAVIRLSAGLESIVQAAGRCNRHGGNPTPQPVYICTLKDEKLGPLREIKDAQAALDPLLAEYRLDPEKYNHDLSSDAAVRAYYTFLYQDMPAGQRDFTISSLDTSLFELLSGNNQFIDDEGTPYYLNQAFKTAGQLFEVFDSANEQVLVPHGQGKTLISQLEQLDLRRDWKTVEALLAQAKPFSVSLSASQIDTMTKKGMIYTLLGGSIHVLNNGNYDDHTGIKEGNDPCSTLIL